MMIRIATWHKMIRVKGMWSGKNKVSKKRNIAT